MNDELLAWRKEFPVLERTVYLISHSLGAMPRQVYERLREYADTWSERSIRAWEEGWWDMPITTGNLVAEIIGAPAGAVVMNQNVSTAVAQVLSCFDFGGRRNKIVYTDMEFPSVMYVCESEERRGARTVRVPSEDGISVPLDPLLAAIDEETLIVPISHVLFKSSFVVDAKAIIRRAHEVGAVVLLDIYQSAGTVPVDVTTLGADFAVGGSVKWLCGGPGAGYLYVHPELRNRLEPRVTGWMAHVQPFAFELPPIRYTDTAMRFLHGTPNIPGLYAARSGYGIIQEIGVEKIRRKSIRQTTRLIELAEGRGFRINCPRAAERRGGTVVIDVPQGEAVAHELLRRDCLVDYRPGAGIRIAPHFYTKDEELEFVIAEVASILETKAYAGHH